MSRHKPAQARDPRQNSQERPVSSQQGRNRPLRGSNAPKLGQHFLRSIGILERIAREACPEDCPLVVEIGPGRGALTEHLLRRAKTVHAVELDPELWMELDDRWGHEKRFHLIRGNAMHVDWSSFGPGVLTGNLPYYVATAIISRYLRNPGNLESGVFLIQKEVADRMTAQPGTSEYGYLSVECQYLAEARSLFQVPPGAFRPPPKVDSAVVRLVPHKERPPEMEAFLKFASACFRQKRKMLRNNLSPLYARELLDAMPESSMRAEQLPVAQLVDLHGRLSKPAA